MVGSAVKLVPPLLRFQALVQPLLRLQALAPRQWCHVNRIAFAIFWIALGSFVLAHCDGYKNAPELNKTHFRPNCNRHNWQICINKLSLRYFQKERRRRIDSFELWCWRRLLRIPWTARRTNKSVIEEIKATNPLETLIKKQQLSYFGHIM